MLRPLAHALQNCPSEITVESQYTDWDKGQSQRRERKNTVDFGVILIITNTLMAIFLYVIVRLIWQE